MESCGKYTVPATETQTEVTRTEETEPETARMETTESAEADPEAAESAEADPETTESEEADPETTESAAADPEAAESAEADSETTESAEADSETTESEVPVCNCEDSCTAENMNESCPVCGVEGATVENCCKYTVPAVEVQIAEAIQLGAPAAVDPQLTAAEKVQAMIDALPTVEELEDAEDETVDEVYAAVQDACDALDELGEEELEQVNTEKLDALLEWFNGQVAALDDGTVTTEEDLRKAVANAASGDTITLGADIALGETLEISRSGIGDFSLTLKMGGHTLTGTIQLTGCDFTVDGELDANVVAKRYVITSTGSSFSSCLYGGTYAGKVSLEDGSGIALGTFKNKVTGTGNITDGIFYDDVACFAVYGGTFLGFCSVKNSIFSGTFYGEHSFSALDDDTYAIIYKKDDNTTYATEYSTIWEVASFQDRAFLGVTDPGKKGCTFLGWYGPLTPDDTYPAQKYELPGSIDLQYFPDNRQLTLYAQWKENDNYSVTFDTNGGNDIASKTGVKWTDKVLDGITDPVKDGWEFTGWKCGDITVKADTTYATLASSDTVGSIELTAQWKDITGPTGEISIGIYSWTTFQYNITFGLFFNDAQTITITASDNSGEDVTIGYLLSDHELTPEIIGEHNENGDFIPYNGGFTIDPDCARVVYAKFTDTSGNVEYISSNGIVLDATAPVISGIEDSKTYCSSQTFTVTETYLDKVTVNGVEVAPDGSNQYTLDPAEGIRTVVATDKAGNKAEMSVTVNDGHTCEWQSENGKYWKKCKYCGDETAKKDIPAITISGADKVCVTQEYKFSFTLPEGTADPVYGYDFETKGDMGLAAVIENGEPYGVVPAEWYEPNKNSFEVYAGATTEDGFEFYVSKTVALQSEHTDTNPKDHICDVCGATLSQHSGGEATCTSKAICEYCGKEYGEIDSTNHNLEHHDGKEPACTEIGWNAYDTCKRDGCNYTTYQELSALGHDLEHVPAKAATVTETGNIEYWQCKDCGDIFSDPDGKNKIELEDTVTAKLPPEIIKGKGQSVAEGEKEALSFTSNAAFSDFIRVELDGKTLDEKNYTASEGSTVVTLNADYVSTLPVGEHTIGIVSESGTASTTFTVNAKTETDNNTNFPQTEVNNTDSPQTGDDSPIALWIALLLASGCLLTVTGIYGKKKKYNR